MTEAGENPKPTVIQRCLAGGNGHRLCAGGVGENYNRRSFGLLGVDWNRRGRCDWDRDRRTGPSLWEALGRFCGRRSGLRVATECGVLQYGAQTTIFCPAICHNIPDISARVLATWGVELPTEVTTVRRLAMISEV